MPNSPSSPPARPNQTSIVAACILSGGLITAAIINSHRPVAVPGGVILTNSAGAEASTAAPPIAQDAARQQFEAQVAAQLTAHKIAPLNEDGTISDFTGVKIIEVKYAAKDDTFTFTYAPLWKEPAETRMETAGHFGRTSPSADNADNADDLVTLSATATNDGYGHYSGVAFMSYDADHSVHFTIQ